MKTNLLTVIVIVFMLISALSLFAQESTATENLILYGDIPWGDSMSEVKAFEAERGFFEIYGSSDNKIWLHKKQHYETLNLSSLPEPYKLWIYTYVFYYFVNDELIRVHINILYDNMAIMGYPLSKDFEQLEKLYVGEDDECHDVATYVISRNNKHISGAAWTSNNNHFMNLGLTLTHPDYSFDEAIELSSE
ncbi:hypothetical protein KAS08_00475 [Candidatus Pacearchaeota archaeon]|nr:hypothetical protein [Candidatus Pacearchaeota archaeon]